MAGCLGIILLVTALVLLGKLVAGTLGIVFALVFIGFFLMWVEGA